MRREIKPVETVLWIRPERSPMLDRIEFEDNRVRLTFDTIVIIAIFFGLLFLAGCGPEVAYSDDPIETAPVETVEIITIRIDSVTPWLTAPDFHERFDRTVEIAKSFWGIDNLGDVTVIFTDHACAQYGGGYGGCAYQARLDPPAWTIEIDPNAPPGHGACIEGTALVHEIGHLAIRDPRHEDPRWDDLMPLWFNTLQALCVSEP